MKNYTLVIKHKDAEWKEKYNTDQLERFEGETPKEQAEAMVDWFNSTRREYEQKRTLVSFKENKNMKKKN